MSLFSDLEKAIERGFRHWTERVFGPAASDDLVILHRAILDDIGSKVQTLARGERVFPFSRISVTLVSPEAERRAILQSAFTERLPDDVREALKAADCAVPRNLTIEVATAESGSGPFRIDYGNALPAASAVSAAPARLIVVKGKAERGEYLLERARTNIGRLAEITDADQRITRRNDIVFDDAEDEANGAVSRRHAHIKLDAGDYRICDDGSEFGTRVFRDGRSIDVPAGNRRGEKLRPGDEIYLGRACLRFER